MIIDWLILIPDAALSLTFSPSLSIDFFDNKATDTADDDDDIIDIVNWLILHVLLLLLPLSSF